MTFDSVILAAVADELNTKLANGRVDKIHQPEPLDIILTIRSNGANHMLLVSADAQSPRIHLTSAKRPNPQTPPNFCMLMRKYLEGAKFIGAEQVDFDRILHLKFSACDGELLTLVVEIMGKHSNAVLINGTGRILGAMKPVGRSKNRYREILPGRQYVSPPSQNKVNPLTVTREAFDALAAPDAANAASWLVKTFTGISPFLARELEMRSKGDPEQLGDEFEALFGKIRSGQFLPVLITDDAGQSIGFYAFPTLQYPEPNQHERSSISAIADMYYMSALPKQTFEQLKNEFTNRVQKELTARERTVSTIQENIVESEGAERYKQIGELILSQMASIPAEAESAELMDYYDPESKLIQVKLDPASSASENAEAYFKKYHKAVSGMEAMKDRLAETNKEIKLLRKILDSADSITSEEQIPELTAILREHGISAKKQEAAETEKQRAEFDGHRISKVMMDGWEVLVGQNSEANDYLLTRIAKPNDWWVHVKASPSAHVVIRTNGKPDSVPKSVLLSAAELAAKHSDSKHSSLVPVDYTLRKYVRKPKGVASGKALYQNEKTIYVTPT